MLFHLLAQAIFEPNLFPYNTPSLKLGNSSYLSSKADRYELLSLRLGVLYGKRFGSKIA
jgi:hypothetical protein